MKFWMQVLAMVATTMALAQSARASQDQALPFAAGAFVAHCSWAQGPSLGEESVLDVRWASGGSQQPVEAPGAFKVALFMPSMGHGSSPTRLERLFDDKGNPMLGGYRASRIYFTMGGKWEVRITVKYPDGHEETRAFPVDMT